MVNIGVIIAAITARRSTQSPQIDVNDLPIPRSGGWATLEIGVDYVARAHAFYERRSRNAIASGDRRVRFHLRDRRTSSRAKVQDADC